MKKTMTILKLAALVVMLVGSMTAEAQTAGGPKGATERVAGIRDIRPQPSAARAAERQGVTAVLQYEKIADMPTPRMSHQVLPSGNGFVVVGGRTTGFVPTKTAELYQDGSWRSLSIGGTHDGAFSVKLADGRYMVGGGFSKQGGVGQSVATDIYDPQTHAFSTGPQLTQARAQAKAVGTGTLVYVSGNWYTADKVMDCYNGSSFQAVGDMDGRSNPYMMADAEGNLLLFSAYDTEGRSFGFHTYDDGSTGLLADRYLASTGQTKYLGLPFTPQICPTALPDDMRSEDYHVVFNGHNCYLILATTTTGARLYMIDWDDVAIYGFNRVDIPTADAEGNTITWRGGVLTNTAVKEAYLIGVSGSAGKQTLHVISLNYNTDEWTIASAPGFPQGLLTASWTVMNDGRLACTGGGLKDNTDAQRRAYIISTPVAGHDYDTPQTTSGPRLVVWLKSGEKVVYELAESPKTTFAGKQLVIRTVKTTATYERKDVLRYTYENAVYLGIDLQPGERRVQMNREGDQITFRGLQAGSTASVYAVNGTLIEQRKVVDGQPLTISLQNRPHGVYIVKAGTETIKVMKQ